jgi:hypothetical protein
VDHLKGVAAQLTLEEVEQRLRQPPRLTEEQQIVIELDPERIEEPDARDLGQSVYHAVEAISSQRLMQEFGDAFANILAAFRSYGRAGPSTDLGFMVMRAALATVGGHLPGVDSNALMAKWYRIVELP